MHEGGGCLGQGVDTTGAIPEEGVLEGVDVTKGTVRLHANERCRMVRKH